MAECKLVVLGGGAVGKSCLTIQFLQHHFVSDYDPTIEDAYRKVVVIDEEPILLDILDTAGQLEFCALRDQYMRHSHGYVLVYSITNRASFEEISDIYESIYRVKDKPTSEPLPMILVGNKCDLEADRTVSTEEGTLLAKHWKISFFESSALTRANVDECFIEIVRSVRRHIEEQNRPKKSQKGSFRKFSDNCSVL